MFFFFFLLYIIFIKLLNKYIIDSYKLKSDKLKYTNKINLVIISNINIINFLFQKYITIHVISSTIESWHFH